MTYVRVKAITKEGDLVAEHAYRTDDVFDAAIKFSEAYPEYKHCDVELQFIDNKDPEWVDWFKVADECGCVHFWNNER